MSVRRAYYGPPAVTITWSTGVGSSSKNRSGRSKSVASKAALLSASSSSAACWRDVLRECGHSNALSGKNQKELLHVSGGGGGGLLRTAAVLTGAQVGRVPVPPVMLGVRLLEVAVALLRLAEEFCKSRD